VDSHKAIQSRIVFLEFANGVLADINPSIRTVGPHSKPVTLHLANFVDFGPHWKREGRIEGNLRVNRNWADVFHRVETAAPVEANPQTEFERRRCAAVLDDNFAVEYLRLIAEVFAGSSAKWIVPGLLLWRRRVYGDELSGRSAR
jgi:hypothetical protein